MECNERRSGDRRKANIEDMCLPSTCQYHALTDAVITDLKEAVHKLMESQEKMRETVITMTEAFKAVERLDARLEKMEDEQKSRDKDQDKKIDQLRAFMYKVSGGAIAVCGMIGWATKFIGG